MFVGYLIAVSFFVMKELNSCFIIWLSGNVLLKRMSVCLLSSEDPGEGGYGLWSQHLTNNPDIKHKHKQVPSTCNFIVTCYFM